LSVKLLIDPFEERLDPRFTVGESVQPFGITGEIFEADFLFDLIECADLFERCFDRCWIALQRFDKISAAMSLIHCCREESLSTPDCYPYKTHEVLQTQVSSASFTRDKSRFRSQRVQER
jgi:hypothetical protein